MKSLLTLLFIFCSIALFAQQDTMEAAYKRYPSIPGLQLLSLDSTQFTKTDLPKKKQVLLMLFSPDCDHCQHEAEQLAVHKEIFKNTQILLVSTYPIHRLKAFAEKYGLMQMENVHVTKDPFYILPSFYQLRNFPYLALYDKKGKLIRTFEGSVSIETISEAFKSAQ